MKLVGKLARWSEDTTYKFVKEYVKHVCLWDVSDENYKNRSVRDAAYSKLQQVMGIKGFGKREIVQKIRNIRSTYCQERRKVTDLSQKTGFGSPYVPKIKWYKILDNALSLIVETRTKTETNAENNFESIDEVDDEAEDTKDFQERLTPIATNLPTRNDKISGTKRLHDDFPEDIADDETEEIKIVHERLTPVAINSPPRSTRPTVSKKRKVQDVEEFVTNVKELNKVINRHIEKNEFEVFGHNIGLQLKNMPLYLALQAQEHIQTYLTRLRLQHMHQQCNVARPSSTSSAVSQSQSHCATPIALSPTCSLNMYSDSSLTEIQDIIDHATLESAKPPNKNILVEKTET